MAGLLYYPMINAPLPVLYQALLYWDHLATVVPPGPMEEFLDTRMLEVHAAGLYRPVPVAGLGEDDVARALPLRRALHVGDMKTRDVSSDLADLAALIDRIPADDLIPEKGPLSYVYRTKISDEFVEELLRQGLAEEADGLRVRVSATTQLWLISAAIRSIACREDWERDGHDVLYPYTDRLSAHSFAHQPYDHAMPCMEVQIGGLLPVPAHEVLISDLIAFRDRYNDERKRLMTAIDLLVHGFQIHYEHPEDVLRALKSELEDALADLKAAGHSAHIEWIRRSVTVSIALTSSYVGTKVVPELGWLLGVVGGVAINAATTTNRRYSRELSRNFSYLDRVQSALD